ncbi:FAD-binding oxidoreductase [Hoeflea prorocentri]|uniref:FAD-binding oxidoreductase n=1 Tax=Hoeflea prorocentri TaxID=1922333 RepID=A0A9X3UMA8_9HYPH|nr:FAD-binding oxidoreductase [Hoeflea prorocentri]MCY6381696.1 FAD-binding oxidoreductase [Hoeflea prorocentri]MDA5399496.1 FAD-binding oxidoreductase [Hoeflea prorocentri]
MTEDILDQFAAIVGAQYTIRDENDLAPYLKEPRGLYNENSPMVLKPGSTEEVSEILSLATKTGTPIVPQAGNTGHVGGQVPLVDGPHGQIILSMSRLNRVRETDAAGNTMTVEAGCVLETIHQAAADINRMFPLTLGSQGSCEIGGNLSTNAGGTAVLAYGNTRQLCLGLEVVLPTGEIWNGLRRLKKDNTGYDLRDLFIGAEGTLGVITAAVIKLHPIPAGNQVAIAGLESVNDALSVFRMAQEACGGALTGFELMQGIAMEFSTRNIPGNRKPLANDYDWYILIDISSSQSEDDADRMMQTIMEGAFEKGLIKDAVLAQSEAQRTAFWQLRETMSAAQKPEGASIKQDVSVPIAAIPEFMAQADRAVLNAMPDARICAFGHMGDGNIHYNISQPVGGESDAHMARRHEISDLVYAVATQMGGSISAEHGIGQMKRDRLAAIRQPIEIDLMRRIKTAFDPANIMNPGKVIDLQG